MLSAASGWEIAIKGGLGRMRIPEPMGSFLLDVADAILDRVVHSAYKITLRGDSMRKTASPLHQSQHSGSTRRSASWDGSKDHASGI